MLNNQSRYDIKGLAEELEFEIEDMGGLFSKYFCEMNMCSIDLRKYFACNNFEMMERVVHNIKGVSANLNVKDVYEEAVIFDDMLKNNKVENANTHINRIIELINNSETEIRKIFCDMNIDI